MAYSDFTLKRAKTELGLLLIEREGAFTDVPAVAVSDYTRETLRRNVPLALAINTEKARSELIIINILLELRAQAVPPVSLFSGIDFTVDKERGLNGFCDYIVSGSAEQLYLDKPVVSVVEAKNESIVSGLGQCLAEMYAAIIFNAQEGHSGPVYGAVTSGDEWKFLRLHNNTAMIDINSYYVNDIGRIIGILAAMTRQEI